MPECVSGNTGSRDVNNVMSDHVVLLVNTVETELKTLCSVRNQWIFLAIKPSFISYILSRERQTARELSGLTAESPKHSFYM